MKLLIYGLNAILLFLIAQYEYNSNSDKTMILSSLAFLVLLVLNLIFGFMAQLDKNVIYRHFYYSALALFTVVFILLSIWWVQPMWTYNRQSNHKRNWCTARSHPLIKTTFQNNGIVKMISETNTTTVKFNFCYGLRPSNISNCNRNYLWLFGNQK